MGVCGGEDSSSFVTLTFLGMTDGNVRNDEEGIRKDKGVLTLQRDCSSSGAVCANGSERWPLFAGKYGFALESSRLCRSGEATGGFGAERRTTVRIDGAAQMAATGSGIDEGCWNQRRTFCKYLGFLVVYRLKIQLFAFCRLYGYRFFVE